jgi:hypothetical protein
MPGALKKGEQAVFIGVKVPAGVAEWLRSQPGGLSKTVRRLVKLAQWEEQGRIRSEYVEEYPEE